MGKSNSKVKPIGGYLSLELSKEKEFHKTALRLNSARSCFELILRSRGYRHVYIPYYTCEVMLQPIERCRVSYSFYHINDQLEIKDSIKLKPDEAIVYTNYFALKQDYIENLANLFGKQLIVDNSQAFFADHIEGIDTFYSPRKFVGVSDGGYLYTDSPEAETIYLNLPQGESYERMQHLLQRIDCGAETAYSVFRHNDDALDLESMQKMSHLTHRLLDSIDYESIILQRRKNFANIHEFLGNHNHLSYLLMNLSEFVPMVYPFYRNDDIIREELINNKIFVALYWQNVFSWLPPNEFEHQLARNIVAIPIDQRYGKDEMNRIIKTINL